MRRFYLITLCLAFLPLANLAQEVSKRNGETPVLNKCVPPHGGGTCPGQEDSSRIPPVIPPDEVPSNDMYVVGTPTCSFNVSNSGAAIYDIKIDVPDAGPLTPKISLTYNSQSAGYGLAGYGVNISGISVITRGNKDLFHDGKQQGVEFNASDNLYLDGKRLIYQSGEMEDSCVVYAVEGDPFTKVFQYGFHPFQVDGMCFKVVTADGLEYEYASDADATLFCGSLDQKKHGCVAWYVSAVRDKNGNFIFYSYDNSGLTVRPVYISYGPKDETGKGKFYNIEFSYAKLGTNARPFAAYVDRGNFDVCLSSIVAACANHTYRKYTLTYDDNSDGSQTKWTRLVQVSEENGKGEKYPPVKLNWSFLPKGDASPLQMDVSTNDDRWYVKESDKGFFATDLNGDGVSDIIRVAPVEVIDWQGYGTTHSHYNTYVYVSRSKVSPNGNVSYEKPLVFSLPANISLGDIKTTMGGASVMDFDGDGYNDLLIPYQDKVEGHWNNVRFQFISGNDVTNGNTWNVKEIGMGLKAADAVPLLVPFDTDGNGKDDVVCVEQRQKDGYYPCTIIKYMDGDKLDHREYKLRLPQNPEKMFVGDYNNDGLQDLIFLYANGYKIYFNAGGKPTDEKFVETKTAEGTNLRNRWRIQQGDFDGDGLIDFVYNCGDGDYHLWVAYNEGGGTFRIGKGVDMGFSDQGTTNDDDKFALLTWDMDRDGLTDVMVCKARYRYRGFPKFKTEFTATEVRWYRSTGDGFAFNNAASKGREDDALENKIFLGDFDGDGQMELANYGSKLTSGDDGFNGTIHAYFNYGEKANAGRVTKVEDGMGTSHSILYAYATNPIVYKRTIANRYPVNTYALPIAVVRYVYANDGSAGHYYTEYGYEDLRLHIAGRGMLGFNKVASTNTSLGIKTSTETTKWDEARWLPTETKTVVEQGGCAATTLSTTTIVGQDKGNYFAYISKQEATDMDGNRTITRSAYDNGKGVPVEEVVENDGDNMYRRVTYGGYVKKQARWLPTTMTKTQKHKDDPSPFSTTTSYKYDDNGNILSTTENYGTEMALTTTNTYNAQGNILTTVTTGKGVKPITKHFEYDNDGRLVVKTFTTPETSVNTFAYDEWGNLLTQTDITNSAEPLTTTHTYDGWGQETQVVAADGTKTKVERRWTSPFSTEQYDIEVASDGAPTVLTCYDQKGRELSKKSVGPKGVDINNKTTYNTKGLVSKIEKTTGKLTTKQVLTYDGRGRLVKEVLSSGKTTTYTYGNRTVTSTIAETGQSVTKTFDAWGNVVKVEDPSGIVTYKYASVGKPASVTAHGSTVCMTYDAAGNQTSLADPDAGTSTYTYAADGTLLAQTDGKGTKITYQFDELGRPFLTCIGKQLLVTNYGAYVNGNPLVLSRINDRCSVQYQYDKLGRMVSEKRDIRGSEKAYKFEYAYNDKNQLSQVIYPGNLEVNYQYDLNGFKTQVEVNGDIVYKQEDYDGLVNRFSFLGKLVSTSVRDKDGFETNLKLTNGNSTLEDFTSEYDKATGNLLSRRRNNSSKEEFGYDNLDRLISYKPSQGGMMKIDYAPNGNMLFKTGVGNYSYDASVRPHAVTEVDNPIAAIPSDPLTTAYNEYGKVDMITDSVKGLSTRFFYGPDQERWCSAQYRDGNLVRSTIYAGDYEEVYENGDTRGLYYLDGNVIVIRDGLFKPYLAFTDNLGSILSVFDEEGRKVFDASYDAWGKQTITQNDIGLYRGYTGHEMLNEYDIINMNGRLYDPVIGRFFSPDNYVQMPFNSQNFNRYSYCLNNPLKYTDPSGEWFGIDDLIVAGAGFVVGYLGNAISSHNWGWSSIKSGLITAGASWLGFNTAGLATGSITSATWRQVGSICLNGIVNKAFPSGNVPLNDHLGFAFSPSFSWTEGGLTAGMLASLSYTDGDFSASVSGGITNNYVGWNAEASYGGWGAGFGKTYYGEQTVRGNVLGKQTVGAITLLAPGDVSFRLYNDMFGQSGHDRWRTSAAELTIGDFSVGTYVTTNDGKKESDIHGYDPNIVDPYLGANPERVIHVNGRDEKVGGGWPNGKVYSAPFWVGIKSGSQIYRFGVSARIVQSLTQNLVHRYLVPTPYFIPGKEFYRGLYSSFGHNSPLSLW
jgi:FG-GAP repeat protein